MHFPAVCVYLKSNLSHKFLGVITTEGAPSFSRFFAREPALSEAEGVGIGDSTVLSEIERRCPSRDESSGHHHDRGCPTLLASFARGWGFDEPKDLRPSEPLAQLLHLNAMHLDSNLIAPPLPPFRLRTPAEPMPSPIKEPPSPPENPDAPVREPDPEEPEQI